MVHKCSKNSTLSHTGRAFGQGGHLPATGWKKRYAPSIPSSLFIRLMSTSNIFHAKPRTKRRAGRRQQEAGSKELFASNLFAVPGFWVSRYNGHSHLWQYIVFRQDSLESLPQVRKERMGYCGFLDRSGAPMLCSNGSLP
jgi:hypothetical protein